MTLPHHGLLSLAKIHPLSLLINQSSSINRFEKTKVLNQRSFYSIVHLLNNRKLLQVTMSPSSILIKFNSYVEIVFAAIFLNAGWVA